MKILVTGANGMLGSAVKEVFKDDELLLTDIDNLNITDYDKVMFYAKFKPDLIMHLAAATDLELCQKFPAYAYMTNHTGAVNMMVLAKKLEIPMVFISTAGVFDGEKDSYDDLVSKPNPINHYGRSKWFAEMSLQNYERVWIFRAGWMMGGGPKIDKKFVNLIFKQIKYSEKKEIHAISDVYGNPTYTIDLAETIKNVIGRASFGIYNCTGKGRASRYDMAKEIINYFNLDIEVIPVKNDFFKNEFPCLRPRNEVLDNWRLNSMQLSCMRPWQTALKEYLKKCYTL